MHSIAQGFTARLEREKGSKTSCVVHSGTIRVDFKTFRTPLRQAIAALKSFSILFYEPLLIKRQKDKR